MNSDEQKANLRDRFPSMQPLKSTPVLTTVNGFGFGVYGHRDEDPETGAYIKTHCFCVLFIPLLAFGAYRVVDAPGQGWYFLGKERLSTFAKAWNSMILALLLASVGGGFWNSYTNSPGYVAKQQLREANAQLASGESLKAATLFGKLMAGSPVAAEARAGLKTALEQCLRSSKAATVEGAFRVLASLGTGANRGDPLVPDAVNRGFALVAQFEKTDPDAALRILGGVGALDPKNGNLRPRQIELLKEVIAVQTNNIDRVVELALIYEKAEQLDESHKVLLPYQAKLGSTEGARLLGQYLLREGQYDHAYGLLFPYVQTRLIRLHQIERAYTNAVGSAYRQAVDHLRNGKGDRSFYIAYDKATKTEQARMVEQFVQNWMQNDPGYKRALAQLTDGNQIIHVTLDLGIVQLNRAQGFSDPAARKTELEAAEKTFLAIRGLAGETDEYRLFLGQVYYWLGRSREGKELFDQLLTSKHRSFPILVALGRTLREVGEGKQAREILEEAYKIAKSDKERFAAAGLRAVLSREVSDKIAWLEKADPGDIGSQIALNNARGELALEQGQKQQAAQFLRKAITGYESMTKSSAVLNNTGLAYLSLHEATGRVEDFNRGMNFLEQAVAIDPGNSILLINITHMFCSRAILDALGEAIRTDLLKESPGLDALGYLYQNEQERKVVYDRLRSGENMKKALVYLDKALLLSPKSRGLYRQELHFQGAFRDLAELQKLQQRLRSAELDEAESRREFSEMETGAKDKEYGERFNTEIRAYESLLASSAVQQHPLTWQYVQVSLNNLKLSAAQYGASFDSAKVLASAQAALQKQGSSAARGSLVAAYYARAKDEVAAQDQNFKALADKTARTLSPKYLITYVLERGGPSAEALRNNANCKQAIVLEKEIGKLFPVSRDADQWALFKTIDPTEASQVVASLKQNAASRLVDELEFQLSPASCTAVLDIYWTRKSFGDEKGAAEFYEQAVSKGVSLPPLTPGSGVAKSAKTSGSKVVNNE